MLTDSPVVRSTGARILFLVGALVTITILQWTHQMAVHGFLPGLTAIFFVLFAYGDYGATICALLILIVGRSRADRFAGPKHVSLGGRASHTGGDGESRSVGARRVGCLSQPPAVDGRVRRVLPEPGLCRRASHRPVPAAPDGLADSAGLSRISS